MLTFDDRFYRCATWAVFVALAIIVLLTFRHYGITWDEELQSQYGLAIVDYYLSGFRDDRYAEIFNLYLYGGMFDGLASIFDRFTPFRVYDTRHLLNACFGMLGLWGTWRLGRFIGGGATALLSLILLTLTPMYYGHMYNNPKDIPFAVGIVWTIYFMARCMAELPQPRWSLILKLSVILGLTLGVRVGGAMIVFFWLAPLGLPLSRIGKEEIKSILRVAAPVGALSYIVMLICWPWAQRSPIFNPLRALNEFSNFPQNVEVLLDGKIYMSTELPWSYLPLYFGVQLPEMLLLLLGLSLISLPWIWRKLLMPQKQALLLLMLMAFMPMLYACLRSPALYDAVRHFLFTVPLMCILAALGARHITLWAIAEFEQRWSRRAVATSIFAIFFIFTGSQLCLMVRLHPYEYIYANSFTGGVPGAYGKYELDYWGSSFREAAEKLQDYVVKQGGIPAGQIYKVAICGPWDSAIIFLPPNYQPVVANEPAEFFLSTTRWQCQDMRQGREIIRIERLGAPLAIVKDLRGSHP